MKGENRNDEETKTGRTDFKEHQVDAVLAALPANIRYLSGFVGSESYLYFSEKQQVILTDSRYTLQAEQEAKGCSVRTISSGRGYAVLLEELLEEDKITRLGFEDGAMLYQTVRELRMRQSWGQKTG